MVVEPFALDTSTCTNSADTFVHKPKRGHLNCLLKSIGERHLPAQSVSIKIYGGIMPFPCNSTAFLI